MAGFILPYAPDAEHVRFVHPKTGESVKVSLPCSDSERVLVEEALGVTMQTAPVRAAKKDGDE